MKPGCLPALFLFVGLTIALYCLALFAFVSLRLFVLHDATTPPFLLAIVAIVPSALIARRYLRRARAAALAAERARSDALAREGLTPP